ncbi:MAG TPA: GNAT family N-acetyltransferase [Chitinophagaceae bacterium]|nr:GNAT family N-acetyltransferase [Chitinophagaceae bacterium]
MNITIRKATEPDFDSIFSLVYDLAVFQGCPERIMNSVEQMKKDQDFFQCYVAVTENKEIVGMASFFFAYYTWVGKSLFLDDLYVKESHRGLKIGSRLLETIFNTALTTNCKRVRWLVSEWNKPAIKFYEGIGATIDEEAWVCDVEGELIRQLAAGGHLQD